MHFITHPEVVIDPEVEVPRWVLTPRGIARMRALAAEPEMADLGSVWASTEAKAIEGAGILAARFGLPVGVHAGLGENDRSGTGYLPEAEFQRVADAFFANPEQSIRGWERAVDAQARIVAAVTDVLAQSPPGPVAVVAHGGVGALLRAHLAGAPIARSWDQPGAGCRFVMREGHPPGDWIRLPEG
ncbi:phosphoglycerate mutase family protein [Acetobacteraceae bacterium AT-5844]|nr:phosphoglycerate mutase family protein [Acetobacteraceae bacterium AT-5844]